MPITYSASGTTGTAKYGGYIKKIEVTIGSQTETLTFDESTKPTSAKTLSVAIANAGTFTPTVTVTDSRDQTATQTLPDITVIPYNVPSVNFDVYRTDLVGVKSDEGHFAVIDSEITYTSGVANLNEPTVAVNGTDVSSDVTWYSSWTSSGGVSGQINDWSSVQSGSHVYGLIDYNFSEATSYQVTMTAEDSLGGTSTPITQTLSTAFYTIDFQAGGKEIAFGAPANDDISDYNGKDYSGEGLFKCNMGADFTNNLTSVDMTTQEVSDFVDDLAISGGSGTFDDGTSEAITKDDLGNVLNDVLAPQVDYIVEQGTS